jgi:hypothetical protein
MVVRAEKSIQDFIPSLSLICDLKSMALRKVNLSSEYAKSSRLISKCGMLPLSNNDEETWPRSDYPCAKSEIYQAEGGFEIIE